MILKLCNILLWIGNNYYKTAAELHYITFFGDYPMIFSASADFVRYVGVFPGEKCKFEKKLFSVHQIQICEKSKWSSPITTRIF